MACGTPVAALDRGAVSELIEDGVTGGVFNSAEGLVAGLPRVMALDRSVVRAVAVDRFGADRMVNGYLSVYETVLRNARRRSAAVT
jgi:glycosyltransferase involved in cell wall biosynthesis